MNRDRFMLRPLFEVRTRTQTGRVLQGQVKTLCADLQTNFSSGALAVDVLKHEVLLDGQPVKLTPKEFDLLSILVRNAGRVVTHRQILTAVWGPAHADDFQYLRVFIGQLRQKLSRPPDCTELILTEPGIGYRLVPEPS